MKRITEVPAMKLPPLPARYGHPTPEEALPRIARRPKKIAGLRHPLVAGLVRTAARRKCSLRHLALKHLGVTQQALDEWYRDALKDPHYVVPPPRVPAISRLTGIPPFYFNPVLWPTPAWRFGK